MSRDDNRRQIDGAEATLARDIERTWRNWKAFVAEQIDEHATQQADETPEADLTGSGAIARRKARIDTATRQQFGAVIEARRQQAQAKAERDARERGISTPDADQIYAALLEHVQNELDGNIHPSGMALVWYKDALIKFDAASVGAGLTDADYLAAGASNAPTKRQALLLLAVVAAMGVVLMFAVPFFFGSPTPTIAPLATTVQVGQQDAQLWTVETAQVGAVPLDARLFGHYPPALCLDAPATKAAETGATVVLTGTQAIRFYRVQPGTAEQADLVLADCTSSPPATKAVAQLSETLTRTILDAQILRAISVRGPDLDPNTIPTNQMEVTLDIALSDAASGTLILADGRRWSPTRSEPTGTGTHLTYLVPLADSAQPAGWELASGAGLPRLLAISLPAPTGRAALLRRTLDVQAGQPTVTFDNGEAELSLTLTVALQTNARPIDLLADDLTVLGNKTPLDARWNPPQLVSGTAATVAVSIPLTNHNIFELALGNWRARITTTE